MNNTHSKLHELLIKNIVVTVSFENDATIESMKLIDEIFHWALWDIVNDNE